MDRLLGARKQGGFPVQGCSLEDLLVVSSNAPGRLGSGELSCIATAYGIRSIAFMTDEKLARKFAKDQLNLLVETTPRLYGYLHYHFYLGESDHNEVIKEHEQYERRPLSKFFQQALDHVFYCRYIVRSATLISANAEEVPDKNGKIGAK